MKVLRITPERCTGCMRCELACSYMQTGMFQPAKSVIRIVVRSLYQLCPLYLYSMCRSLVSDGLPGGGDHISAVGAKVVMDDICVGCKLCTIACPYGTMFTTRTPTKPPSVTSVMASPPVSPRVRPRPLNMSRRKRAIGWGHLRRNALLDASPLLPWARREYGTDTTRHCRQRHGGDERPSRRFGSMTVAPRRSSWWRLNGRIPAWCCRISERHD